MVEVISRVADQGIQIKKMLTGSENKYLNSAEISIRGGGGKMDHDVKKIRIRDRGNWIWN